MESEWARLVAEGYDRAADRYAVWQEGLQGSPRDAWVERLLGLLPPAPEILELGVGAGVASTRRLAGLGRLTGVDLSEAQLARARARLPGATLLQADMTRLELPPRSFDAVVALYTLMHVPRAELAPLLGRIAGWLRPGGLLLATLTAGDSPDTVEEWLGVPMPFSGFDADTNRRLLRAAGFSLLADEVVTQREPGADESFLWVLART
jgi:SAM-dependent methyltransferase